MDEARQKIAKLESLLKEKDKTIEQLLMDQEHEVTHLRKSLQGNFSFSPAPAKPGNLKCENCERMRQRWKKISRNFQEVPKLLETMILRTDKLFEDTENQ
jgi:tRNA A37 threonylcarbamoyltransferase TsaD